MKLLRREFLHVDVIATTLPALPRIASALDYPMRTVRVIVPFAPGGPLDVFGRLRDLERSDPRSRAENAVDRTFVFGGVTPGSEPA
jgi:hypothetical protein